MLKICMLINGFDKYFELWETNIYLLKKYVDFDRIKVYFSTEEKNINEDKIINIKTGLGLSWCDRTIKSLNQICDKYVLLLMDDYFLIDNLNVNKINIIGLIMDKYNMDCFRLSPYPSSKDNCYVEEGISYGKINNTDQYSISLQASIWKKDSLISILKKYNTAWEVEWFGSKECGSNMNIYCINPNMATEIYHDIGTEGAIHRGKFTRNAVKIMKKMEIPYSKNISVEPWYRAIFLKFRDLFSPLIQKIRKTKWFDNYRRKKYSKIMKSVDEKGK